MATYQDYLSEIAQAIRAVEGSTDPIPAKTFAARIRALSGGGGGEYLLQSKSVTPTKASQIITADTSYYGLSSVEVGAIPDKYQDVSTVTAAAEDVRKGKIIVTAHGEVSGAMPDNGGVNIFIPSGESYTIPQGYHNGHGKVTAQGGGAPVLQALEVIENGQYTPPSGVDGYNLVDVNVPTGGGGFEAQITAESEDPSLGTVSGGGSFGVGDTVTLQGTPIEGKALLGWYEGEKQVSVANPFVITIPSPDHHYTARFGDPLPEGYTRAKALYHSAKGVIQLGFTATSSSRIEIQLSITELSELSNIYASICGYYSSRLNRLVALKKDYETLSVGANTVKVPSLQGDLDTPKTMTLDFETGELLVDGTVCTTNLSEYLRPSFSFQLCTAISTANKWVNGYFYGVKVYRSGVLDYDFVPCTNSAGKAGFYDIINNTFKSSGTASAWSAVQ